MLGLAVGVQPVATQSASSRDAALPNEDIRMDFTAAPESVTAVAEGERLSFGHMGMHPLSLSRSQRRWGFPRTDTLRDWALDAARVIQRGIPSC